MQEEDLVAAVEDSVVLAVASVDLAEEVLEAEEQEDTGDCEFRI